MSYCTIKGPCGHEADIDRFCFAQPKGTFKCPICGKSFQVVQEPPTVYPSGFIMPGKRSIQLLD
jgi:hypothetical protein